MIVVDYIKQYWREGLIGVLGISLGISLLPTAPKIIERKVEVEKIVYRDKIVEVEKIVWKEKASNQKKTVFTPEGKIKSITETASKEEAKTEQQQKETANEREQESTRIVEKMVRSNWQIGLGIGLINPNLPINITVGSRLGDLPIHGQIGLGFESIKAPKVPTLFLGVSYEF